MSYRTKLYLGCHWIIIPYATWFCYNILHRVGYLAPIFLCCSQFPILRPMSQCRSCAQFWARETDSESVGFDIQCPILFPVWFTAEVHVGWTYNRIFLSTSVSGPSTSLSPKWRWFTRAHYLVLRKSRLSQNQSNLIALSNFDVRSITVKVSRKITGERRKKQIVHHRIIFMVCTRSDHSSQPISAREIA